MNYFLIGIKGTGMSALAQLLKEANNKVLGSDVKDYFFTEDILYHANIPVYEFGKADLNASYIYIISNAYDEKNSDFKTVLNNQYIYYYYHEFIGKCLNKKIIAVSGTHGKTTTSSFLTQMLEYKTSYIVGDGSGGSYDNDLLVVEACEYKDHFLSYHPEILIINNIEMDHPDYFKSINQLITSFQNIANQTKLVIINGDDLNCKQIKHNNIIKVGFKEHNDIIIKINNVHQKGYNIVFTYLDNKYNLNIEFTGLHMIRNIVNAYLVCLLLNKKPNLDLTLPRRRMNEIKYGNTILVDDYAHHPTEIKCLYESLKIKYPNYLLKVIFQPHTYTRTIKLKKGFKEALDLFDNVYIEKVFTSKRESKSQFFQKQIDQIFRKYQPFNNKILDEIDKNKKEIWIFLGAGTVDSYIMDLK